MNRSAFSAVVVAAALLGSLYSATGQIINPTVQTASPRVVATRGAPATAGRPVASARVMPQVAARPMGFYPQRLNSNLQRTYAPPVRPSNFTVATLNAPRGGAVQQPIAVDPATRQTELRTLAAMRQRRGVVTRDGNIVDPATRQNELRTLATMRERRPSSDSDQTPASINPQRRIANLDPRGGASAGKARSANRRPWQKLAAQKR